MVSFESLKSEYKRNWANLEIRPGRLAEANAVARKAISGKATYQQVERLTGVPWHFIALCHYRESNFDFDTYLGNGETLHRVTCLVPKGRGPFASFADHVFDPSHVDSQLGTAVILHAMMSQDSSITLDGSPPIASRSEPDDDMASSVLLMQQALNKLGANPPLDEDGICGPKTKAAVSQFQQRNGLQDTGLLDGTTIAAITRAGTQTVQAPNVDLSQILKRLEDLARLLQGGSATQGGATSGGTTSGGVTSRGTTTVANDPISLLERLLSLANNAAPVPGAITPTNPAPADQLKPIVDLLGALLNKDGKPVLGQVNGALGETIGKMLDGKKTALGIGGSLITAL